MNLKEFEKLTDFPENGMKMPALFVGHGSPMNAIEENEFVRGWRLVGQGLPKPKAILCISAHWETRGTFVTAMEQPRTIHDFGGFPKELYDINYPALGSPQLADVTKEMVHSTVVGLDQSWGLDHGCWSVLIQMFPKADIPVYQLSLDQTKPARYHFELAKELSGLRDKGVLIIGSGNMVHNLRLIAWDKLSVDGFGYDWAIEANETMKLNILSGNFDPLINYQLQGKAFHLSIPTPEHFLPLMYVLALKENKEHVQIFNDKALMGSLTMTSLKIVG